MASRGYEIELVRTGEQPPTGPPIELKPGVRVSSWPNDWDLSMMATLTGLPKAEIWEMLPEHLRTSRNWGARYLREAAEALHFNYSPRFVPFDPATPWPCLLRFRKTKAHLAAQLKEWNETYGDPDEKPQDYWYLAIYNQGRVYECDAPLNQAAVMGLELWKKYNQWARITSMLSIWLDNKLILTAKDF